MLIENNNMYALDVFKARIPNLMKSIILLDEQVLSIQSNSLKAFFIEDNSKRKIKELAKKRSIFCSAPHRMVDHLMKILVF